jgi:hypothetical protein
VHLTYFSNGTSEDASPYVDFANLPQRVQSHVIHELIS